VLCSYASFKPSQQNISNTDKDNYDDDFGIAGLFDNVGNEEMGNVEPDGTAVNQIEHQVGLLRSRLTSVELKY
jgi:hypothetical protein